MAAVGTSLLPSLWGWTRSMLEAGIGALKGLAQSVKRCAQSLGGRITSSITGSMQFMKGLSGLLICEIWLFCLLLKGVANHAVMLFKIYSKINNDQPKKFLFFKASCNPGDALPRRTFPPSTNISCRYSERCLNKQKK